MKTIAVVINARLESTRCPRKHVRDLEGTTIIDICLEKVNKLKNVEEKYLAAYEKELFDKLKGYKTIKHLNRKYDSVKKGQAPIDVAFRHYKEVKSDYIMIFNPCQPFVDLEVYQKAIDWFKKTPYVGATSVVEEKNFFFWSDGSPANFKTDSKLSTQFGPSMLASCHTFHFFNKDYFIKTKNLWTNSANNPHPYKIPNENLMDVDTEEDFATVKAIMRERNA